MSRLCIFPNQIDFSWKWLFNTTQLLILSR